MPLSPLYHRMIIERLPINMNALTGSMFDSQIITKDLLEYILRVIAQSNSSSRSVLKICKTFYQIGFPIFHQEIDFKFFINKIGKGADAFNFFLLPNQPSLELSLPKVNPSASGNVAIRLASKNGYAEVVKGLLEDPRVNPAVGHDYAIRIASENGHADVVRELLKYKEVNPAAENNYAIRIASENGHADVVRELLKYKGINPAVGRNYAIRKASDYNHLEVVQELLKDSRVNPSDNDNEAIRWASEKGHVEVVKLLLKDKRVNPAVKNHPSLCLEIENNYDNAIKEFLEKNPVKSYSSWKLKLIKIIKRIWNLIGSLLKLRPPI